MKITINFKAHEIKGLEKLNQEQLIRVRDAVNGEIIARKNRPAKVNKIKRFARRLRAEMLRKINGMPKEQHIECRVPIMLTPISARATTTKRKIRCRHTAIPTTEKL